MVDTGQHKTGGHNIHDTTPTSKTRRVKGKSNRKTLDFFEGHLQAGDRIGSYEIIDKIAQGGSATIYRAEHVGLQRSVALKVMAPALAKHPDLVEMFVREAHSTSKLKHPNIVQTYDAGTIDGTPYLAMELIDGGNLMELIIHRDDVKLLKIIEIMLAIVDALNYGQERLHLTHGDIKPENVIIDLEGVPHLADFGLAETIACRRKRNEGDKKVYITPLYAAPETLSRTSLPGEPHPDIYSFGCMMYHVITGEPPFQDNQIEQLVYSHMQRIPPELESMMPDINSELSKLVAQMLSKNPAKRPGSWKEIHSRLASIIDEMKKPLRFTIKKHFKLAFTFNKREQFIFLLIYAFIFICQNPILGPFLIICTILVNYFFKTLKEPHIWIKFMGRQEDDK